MEKKFLNPDELWDIALGCVVKSGLPDVGEVVAISQTLKDHVHLAACGSEEEIAAVIPQEGTQASGRKGSVLSADCFAGSER